MHAGEAEAIALAIELDCPLIIDERLGSRAAIEHGVHKVGILGLLVASKLEGLLPAVRPVIDELIRVDFRASPKLLDQILRMAARRSLIDSPPPHPRPIGPTLTPQERRHVARLHLQDALQAQLAALVRLRPVQALG